MGHENVYIVMKNGQKTSISFDLQSDSAKLKLPTKVVFSQMGSLDGYLAERFIRVHGKFITVLIYNRATVSGHENCQWSACFSSWSSIVPDRPFQCIL